MEVLDAPRITPEIVAEHGLAAEEYDRILKALGRKPNLVERPSRLLGARAT